MGGEYSNTSDDLQYQNVLNVSDTSQEITQMGGYTTINQLHSSILQKVELCINQLEKNQFGGALLQKKHLKN